MITSLYFLLSIGLSLLYFCTFNTYKKGWLSVDNTGQNVNLDSSDTVTVIIAGRNEAKNIINLLTSLSKQDYPFANWDIVLVDDHSEDQMVKLATEFNLSNLRIIKNDQSKTGKKEALTTAIKHNSSKYILFTDADCQMGPNWISSMIGTLKSSDGHMVTGPVYMEGDHSFLNQYQSVDLAGMMVVTGGAVQNGTHPMANGANMAVISSKMPRFDVLKGTAKASGDDMFLAQHFMDEGKLAFVKDERAIVRTKVENDWPSVLRQRRRWASKNTLLSGIKTKANFVIIIGFYINLFVALFSYFWIGSAGLAVFMISMTIKVAADNLLLKEGTSYFNVNYDLAFLIQAQPIQIWLTLSAFFSSIFQLPFDWKGRSYR